MSNTTNSRFERHSLELADLTGALAEAGMVWGRDFELVGFPEPDAFELRFQNEALAVRASVLWTARTMPRVKRIRAKAKKGTSRKASKPAGTPRKSATPKGTAPRRRAEKV